MKGSAASEYSVTGPALAVIWLMSFLIPLVFIKGSYNEVLVKLPVFTALSGVLLFIAGLRFLKEPCSPGIPLILIILAVVLTAAHLYQPSNEGISRIILAGSGLAVFLSVRILRLDAGQILKPLLYGGIAAFIVSLLMPNVTNRLFGTFGNPNLIGSYAAGLFPVGLGVLWGKGWKRLTLLVLVSAVCLVVVYKSGTRAGMVALPAGIAAALLLRRNRKLLFPLAILYLSAVFILLFQNVLHAPLLGGSAGVRQVIWQGSSEMFLQKPVFGWGTGSFQPVFPSFRPGDYVGRGVSPNTVHAHSEPVELLTENGLAGLFIWSVLFLVLLRRRTEEHLVTAARWGAVAGIAVLLIEGLVSVALRWTSSFFLLTMLVSALSGGSVGNTVRVPKWTACIPFALALLLIGPGTVRTYMMNRSLLLYDAAVMAQRDGMPADVSMDLCLGSLRCNSWELESWSLLGSLYGIQADRTDDRAARSELLLMQLAVYDSLAARAPDYGLLVLNRSRVHVRLGMWDSAMDDLMHMYRTQFFLKRLTVDAGTRIAPLADAEKSLQFMNLVYSSLLVTTGGEDSLQNARRLVDAIGVTYALAENYAPDAVDVMRRTTDSILAAQGNSFQGRLNRVIEKELLLAREGQILLVQFDEGLREGIEQQCLSSLADTSVYAPFQRWLLCMISAGSGRGKYLEIAGYHAFLLHDTCYPLVGIFPGGTEIFSLIPEISSACENPDHQYLLLECFHRVLEMEAFSLRVKSYLAESTGADEDHNGPEFRSENLMQLNRILCAPEVDSPEFRTAAEFTMGCLGMALPGSEAVRSAEYTLGIMGGLREELAGIHGVEDAQRIFLNIITGETNYLADGPFPPEAEAAALWLKNRLSVQ